MNHVVRAGRRERVRDLRDDPQRLVGRHAARFLQAVPDASARHIVHDDIIQAVLRVLSGVVDRDQVRMPDLAGQFRLPDEPVDELFVLGGDVGGQDLQRELRIKHVVPHEIHRSHAALPELLFDGVLLEDRPGFQAVVDRNVFFRASEPLHGKPPDGVHPSGPRHAPGSNHFKVGSFTESSQSAWFMPWRISSGYRLVSLPVRA